MLLLLSRAIWVADAQFCKYGSLQRLHFLGLRLGIDVIVAGKMEQSMNDQMGRMVFERHALVRRLARAGLVRERDVAKHDRGAIGGEVCQLRALQHREAEHVGRLVAPAPIAVERVDFGVRGEQQARDQARVGKARLALAHRRRGSFGERLPVAWRPILDVDIKLHHAPSLSARSRCGKGSACLRFSCSAISIATSRPGGLPVGDFMHRILIVFAAGICAAAPLPALAQPAMPDPAPATAEEEVAAVAWLKDKGVAFDPGAYDGDSLAPLAEQLGKARIIGIGEATHGSHQDQAFKAELIKQLVRSGKVTVLMLEANRDAGEQFDRYVREGAGDPAEAVRAESFFRIWKNDEFGGLLLWLRAWNQKAAIPVRIIGVDCQDAGRDSGVALEFIAAHDPAKAAQWAADMGGLKPGVRFVNWLDTAERAEFDRVTATTAALAGWFESADDATRAAPGFARARFAAVTAQQALAAFEFDRDDSDKSRADPAYYARRDKFMGENALAMLAPDERAVIWAHDSHVMEDIPDFLDAMGFQTLGTTIADKLGADYATVGFTWSQGSFRSTVAPLNADGSPDMKTRRNLEVVTLPNNRTGELGNLFDRTGAQAMWIDLATRPDTPLIASWSTRPYWRGWAGALVMPGKWQVTDLSIGEFAGDAVTGHDVIVWFQTITPTRLWPQADPPVTSAP